MKKYLLIFACQLAFFSTGNTMQEAWWLSKTPAATYWDVKKSQVDTQTSFGGKTSHKSKHHTDDRDYRTGKGWAITSIICAVLCVLCIIPITSPLVLLIAPLGILGTIAGFIALSRANRSRSWNVRRLAMWGLIVSGAAVLAFIIGAIVTGGQS